MSISLVEISNMEVESNVWGLVVDNQVTQGKTSDTQPTPGDWRRCWTIYQTSPEVSTVYQGEFIVPSRIEFRWIDA